MSRTPLFYLVAIVIGTLIFSYEFKNWRQEFYYFSLSSFHGYHRALHTFGSQIMAELSISRSFKNSSMLGPLCDKDKEKEICSMPEKVLKCAEGQRDCMFENTAQ